MGSNTLSQFRPNLKKNAVETWSNHSHRCLRGAAGRQFGRPRNPTPLRLSSFLKPSKFELPPSFALRSRGVPAVKIDSWKRGSSHPKSKHLEVLLSNYLHQANK